MHRTYSMYRNLMDMPLAVFREALDHKLRVLDVSQPYTDDTSGLVMCFPHYLVDVNEWGIEVLFDYPLQQKGHPSVLCDPYELRPIMEAT